MHNNKEDKLVGSYKTNAVRKAIKAGMHENKKKIKKRPKQRWSITRKIFDYFLGPNWRDGHRKKEKKREVERLNQGFWIYMRLSETVNYYNSYKNNLNTQY